MKFSTPAKIQKKNIFMIVSRYVKCVYNLTTKNFCYLMWGEEKDKEFCFFLNYLISSVSSGFQWTEFDGFTITFLISFEKRQFIVWMGTTWHIYLSQWVVIWLWFIVWVIKLNCSNILILNCNETCGQIPFFTWKLI